VPRKVLLCFGDSNSGMPMPEISSYRGSWGERSCPSGATGWFGHTTFQLWGGHSTTELSSPQHNLRRQCLGVRWCYDATVERYWGTNDTRKRIKLALTIYRDFMQNFLSDFERRDNKNRVFAGPQSIVISFLCSKNYLLKWWKWLCLARKV